MVTVKELLTIPLLKRLKILAGRSGLDNLISHVTVLEIPDVAKWIKKNGFIITSFYAIRNDIQEQVKIVDKLIEYGCSCLAIKTGEYIKKIDESIVKKADENGLVLLEIPPDLNYIDIIYTSMEKILKNKDFELSIAEYLKDLIFNQSSINSSLIERGRLLGLNIVEDYSLAGTMAFLTKNKRREEIEKILHKITTNAKTYIPIIKGNNTLTIFLFDSSKKSIEYELNSITDKMIKSIGHSMSNFKIGIGSIGKGINNIKHSYYSSLDAIKTGNIIRPDELIYSYDDLELYCKLINFLEQESISVFQDIKHKLNDENLIITLEQYFKHNMDINKVAESMFVHKNTVRYRLNKIANLTGLNINLFEDNLKLYLSLLYIKISEKNNKLSFS
jgi:purine catabolism regulator